MTVALSLHLASSNEGGAVPEQQRLAQRLTAAPNDHQHDESAFTDRGEHLLVLTRLRRGQ